VGENRVQRIENNAVIPELHQNGQNPGFERSKRESLEENA
jgi:hypothetical protein